MIGDLLAGTFHAKEPAATPAIGAEANAPLPLLNVLVRPAMPVAEVGMSPGAQRRVGTRYEAWGLDLKRMLAMAYDVAELRVLVSESLPTTRYDVSMTLPDANGASRKAMLRQVLATGFALNARREARQMDVYVLGKTAGAPALQASDKGRTLRSVVDLAESVLRRPVLDETGLTGNYDFVLSYTSDPQVLMAAVKELGLQLVPERRSIEVLVAERMGTE